jgi:hypothetical protein
MKSTGTFTIAWSSACLAMVSAPMLTPAKKVEAKTTPSKSAVYNCQDRTRCLATYEMGNQLASCTGLRSAKFIILLCFLLSLYFRTRLFALVRFLSRAFLNHPLRLSLSKFLSQS